jgi:beta-galactosidase
MERGQSCTLGVCYYPEQWPESRWAEDARAMADFGIRYVRIAEFAWSRIEPERGPLHVGLARSSN